jgi:hypothetical protein
MTADRRAAQEALSEYDAEGGTPLEQLKQELDRRAALVERVRKVAGCWPAGCDEPEDCACQISIDLVRDEVLEEAIECLDKSGCEQGALAIRALKEAPCSSS